jgi:hypothetical protein
VIYRVLVLLFAIVLIAAGTERLSADVCSDSVADILDDDAVMYVDQAIPLLALSSTVQTATPGNRIAPAPSGLRVFRPPRTVRA